MIERIACRPLPAGRKEGLEFVLRVFGANSANSIILGILIQTISINHITCTRKETDFWIPAFAGMTIMGTRMHKPLAKAEACAEGTA